MTSLLETSAVLHNGTKMPLIGLGTWQVTEEQLDAAIPAALEAGYRHIDCAFNYKNEVAIGSNLKKYFDSGKLNRKDLFITSKLPMIGNHASSVEKFLKKSLEDLQLDYLDLYLIHFPVGFRDPGNWDDILPKKTDGSIDYDMNTDLVAVWKAMEAQVDAGRTRAIGVSDFNCLQVAKIIENARIAPVVWQMELHAYHQQPEAQELCRRHGIVVTAAAPLGSPGMKAFLKKMGVERDTINLLENDVVTEIANKYGKSPAQILLRHATQNGIVAIPKSATPSRIAANISIFDFELSAEDMQKLNSLDKGEEGRTFQMEFMVDGKKHPEWPFKNEK